VKPTVEATRPRASRRERGGPKLIPKLASGRSAAGVEDEIRELCAQGKRRVAERLARRALRSSSMKVQAAVFRAAAAANLQGLLFLAMRAARVARGEVAFAAVYALGLRVPPMAISKIGASRSPSTEDGDRSEATSSLGVCFGSYL